MTDLKVAAAAQGTAAPFAAVNAARTRLDQRLQGGAAESGRHRHRAVAYAAAASNMVVAAADAAGATAAQQAAITAAAISSGNTAGNTPDEVDNDIAAAVAVPAVAIGHLDFDANGALSNALMAPQTLPLTVGLPIFPPTGAATMLSINFGFAGTTQYGAATSEKKSTQDGYTAGHLQRFSAGADGIILGQYSNGQSHALGQIVLANFANPNGLSPLGNNAWAETSNSGVPLVGTPAAGSLGVLQSSAVENSNVRPDGRTGQHDHRAACLPGQCADHQDPGLGAADAGQPALIQAEKAGTDRV